ncbi:hypothetical protein [Zavarzinia sp.]|uniref:hypothetical protein n=1 Tax=Zavarzinia sp. TaxID=2027920 RepID=UPI0035649EFE
MAYRLSQAQRRAVTRLADSPLARALSFPIEGRALKGRAIAARLQVESLRWATAFAIGPVMAFSVLLLVGLITGRMPGFMVPLGGVWFALAVITLAGFAGWFTGRRVLKRFYADVQMQQADAPDFICADARGLTVTGAGGFRLEGPWSRWRVSSITVHPPEGQGRAVGRRSYFRAMVLALDGDAGKAVALDPLLIERGAALCAVTLRALEKAGAFAAPEAKS